MTAFVWHPIIPWHINIIRFYHEQLQSWKREKKKEKCKEPLKHCNNEKSMRSWCSLNRKDFRPPISDKMVPDQLEMTKGKIRQHTSGKMQLEFDWNKSPYHAMIMWLWCFCCYISKMMLSALEFGHGRCGGSLDQRHMRKQTLIFFVDSRPCPPWNWQVHGLNPQISFGRLW